VQLRPDRVVTCLVMAHIDTVPNGDKGRQISYVIRPGWVEAAPIAWSEQRWRAERALDWLLTEVELDDSSDLEPYHQGEWACTALLRGFEAAASNRVPGSERDQEVRELIGRLTPETADHPIPGDAWFNWTRDLLETGLKALAGAHLSPGQVVCFIELRTLATAARAWPPKWVICRRCGLVIAKPRGGRYCGTPKCVHGRDPRPQHDSGAAGQVVRTPEGWGTIYHVACCDPACVPVLNQIQASMPRLVTNNRRARLRGVDNKNGSGSGTVFTTSDPRRLYCDQHATPAAEQRRYRTTGVGGITAHRQMGRLR
jgi:hypothetical protein